MSQLSERSEMDAITDVFDLHPNGLSIGDIKAKIAVTIAPHTLQRRLAKLIEQGKLRMQGTRKTAIYHPVVADNRNQITTSQQSSIQLSEDGHSLLSLITSPVASRRPVTYHPEFLQNYIPNENSYLSTNIREQLASIGQTSRLSEPAGTYAKNIFNRLLIDLAWNSSRLEGNTYSLLDTERLLREGEQIGTHSSMETQMILNHKEAIEFLVESAGEIGFNGYTLLNLHGILSANLLPDPAASGRLRTHGVGIHGSAYTPPSIPQQIIEWFNVLLQKAEEIEDPFEQAFFVMVHLPYLQPFDDVNKRVSRLAANIPLIRRNLSPLSFIDVPADLYTSGLIAVYEYNDVTLFRDVFVWAYTRSAARYASIVQTLGEPDPFRLRYRDEIKQVVSKIISDLYAPTAASDFIRQSGTKLPEADRQAFINTVEAELLALHKGNFARYRVRPSQFDDWMNLWKRG